MLKMTKKTMFLSICCMFLVLLTYAQDNNLKTQLQLLKKKPEHEFYFNSKGFLKIENAKFYTKSGDTNVFVLTPENIHLIDFNNDGEKDVIYQENKPYKSTILLVKRGNDFVEIWNGTGTLVQVKQGEITNLYIRRNAIGCLYTSTLFELSIKNDSSFTENIISIHSETELNEVNTIFEQKIISGILRTQAIEDDTKKTDPCTGDLKIGNQLRIMEKEQVTVIKKQNEWLLIVAEEKNQSMIGWVKNW